jgi:sarcosine oxidase
VTTSPPPYDVIVVGLGAMGSASLDALAGAKKRVLGIDQFAPPHSQGSSHGRTRITREAYFESPSYVPIVRRATELWRELERGFGRPLLVTTGGLSIGPEGSALVRGTLASAQAFRVLHRVLSAAGVQRQFPGLQPLDDMVGVFDDRAGVLFPELCGETRCRRAPRRARDQLDGG